MSIAGRSTASIIDGKKHFLVAASEAAFSQVFQLGEAAAKNARTLWQLCRGSVLLRFEVGSGGG